MNMGQTMITTGAFMLLIMSVISANRILTQNLESTLQAEALEISATIAEDLIAEASAKEFDDLDDYNNYSRRVDAGGINGFLVESYVYYVDPQHTDVPLALGSTSNYKRMEVIVSHPVYMVKNDGSPLKIPYSTIMSY